MQNDIEIPSYTPTDEDLADLDLFLQPEAGYDIGPSLETFIKRTLHAMPEGATWAGVGTGPGHFAGKAKPHAELAALCKAGTHAMYFSIAATSDEMDRTQDSFVGTHVLVIDDVGTKCQLDELPELLKHPSYIIESSPGNFQYGFIYDAPVTDLEAAGAQVKAVYAAGSWDPEGASANKLVRLPFGVHHEHPGHRVRLVSWHPDRHFTPEQIMKACGISGNESPANPSPQSSARIRDKDNLPTEIIDGQVVKSIENMTTQYGQEAIEKVKRLMLGAELPEDQETWAFCGAAVHQIFCMAGKKAQGESLFEAWSAEGDFDQASRDRVKAQWKLGPILSGPAKGLKFLIKTLDPDGAILDGKTKDDPEPDHEASRDMVTVMSGMLMTQAQLAAKELPARNYRIRPWMEADSMGIISAPPGVGKSWFGLSLCISLLTGEKWLDKFPIETRMADDEKILVLDSEMTEHNLQDRWNQMVRALPEDKQTLVADRLVLLPVMTYQDGRKNLPRLDVSNPTVQKAIEELAKQINATMLILDNRSGLMDGETEENSNDGAVKKFNDWGARMRNKHISSMMVSHSGKAGQGPRGGSAWTGAASWAFHLDGKPTETSFTMYPGKMRGLPLDENVKVHIVDEYPDGYEFNDVNLDDLGKIIDDPDIKAVRLTANQGQDQDDETPEEQPAEKAKRIKDGKAARVIETLQTYPENHYPGSMAKLGRVSGLVALGKSKDKVRVPWGLDPELMMENRNFTNFLNSLIKDQDSGIIATEDGYQWTAK